MAIQEYFINEESEKLCSDSAGTIYDARKLPPVIYTGDDDKMIIKVKQKDIDDDRCFCYRVYDNSPSIISTSNDKKQNDLGTMINIEKGTRFLTQNLFDISYRDNMFAVAFTTSSGDNYTTLACIFYDDEAYFRYSKDWMYWWPVGPCAIIKIDGCYSRTEAMYQVYFNQYHLDGSYKCRKHEDVMLYYYTLGINWLENALNYRADYVEARK